MADEVGENPLADCQMAAARSTKYALDGNILELVEEYGELNRDPRRVFHNSDRKANSAQENETDQARS
jgi:hypothetical protein